MWNLVAAALAVWGKLTFARINKRPEKHLGGDLTQLSALVEHDLPLDLKDIEVNSKRLLDRNMIHNELDHEYLDLGSDLASGMRPVLLWLRCLNDASTQRNVQSCNLEIKPRRELTRTY